VQTPKTLVNSPKESGKSPEPEESMTKFKMLPWSHQNKTQKQAHIKAVQQEYVKILAEMDHISRKKVQRQALEAAESMLRQAHRRRKSSKDASV